MEIKKGTVVISKAGHDKGDLLYAVRTQSDMIWVSDGRQRPLSRPKKKNPKHLIPTSLSLSEEETQTDRGLRKALFKLKSETQNQGG